MRYIAIEILIFNQKQPFQNELIEYEIFNFLLSLLRKDAKELWQNLIIRTDTTLKDSLAKNRSEQILSKSQATFETNL